MNNVIRFTVSPNGRFLVGCDVVVDGAHELHLGSVPVSDINYGLTEAMREFNLPNAVAPGEWPNPHEQVTCDQDPRRVLARSAAHNAEQQALDSETFRARWGCD